MENRDILNNPITSTAGGIDTAVYFVDEVEALQAEIDRLTIAYENASEQRQHYVGKCLELSEVVLRLSDEIDFTIKQFNSRTYYNLKCREVLTKHEDVINRIKRSFITGFKNLLRGEE